MLADDALALQGVSSCCALPDFKPADHDCLWLLRLWVTAVPYCVSCLLIMPVFGSSVCEWLLCLLVFHAFDDACPPLFRLWVAVVPCRISNLLNMTVFGFSGCKWLLCLVIFMPLMMPVLGSSDCEWLLYLAEFQACWSWLSLALQCVSVSCALLYFMPVNDIYS